MNASELPAGSVKVHVCPYLVWQQGFTDRCTNPNFSEERRRERNCFKCDCPEKEIEIWDLSKNLNKH